VTSPDAQINSASWVVFQGNPQSRPHRPVWSAIALQTKCAAEPRRQTE